MNNRNIGRFFLLMSFAFALGLPTMPIAQAVEAAKPATQADKPAKAKAAESKSAKKNAPEGAKAGDCLSDSKKKWHNGASCRTTCDAKGTLCDMRLCKSGSWKNYGSCFGPGAVAANCPASCE